MYITFAHFDGRFYPNVWIFYDEFHALHYNFGNIKATMMN